MSFAEQMLLISLTTSTSSLAHITNSDALNIELNDTNYNTGITNPNTSTVTDEANLSNLTVDPLNILKNGCNVPSVEWHENYFGVQLAVAEWEAILTAIVLSIIIVLTIIGNILVILSVFTYKPLRIVQNFFIVSLAVADLTVALLVLPFNVAYSILGRWVFGIYLCKMWLTCDIMCCTSSILNLCAIALDRYWAITDPINYAQKRTVGRVLLLISGVWILSLVISSPPLIGWNDWPEVFTSATPCELNSDPGYVIYSSLGSFFIPLIIMATVYIEIFIATRRRLRERAQAAKKNTIAARLASADVTTTALNLSDGGPRSCANFTVCCSAFCCFRNTNQFSSTSMIQNDRDSISSEAHANNETSREPISEYKVVIVTQRKTTRRAKIKDSIKHEKSKAQKTPPNTKTGLNSAAIADYGGGKSRLLCPQTKNINGDNPKPPMEGENVPKGYNGDENEMLDGYNDVENTSLKITPPQSSVGTTSAPVIPLEKKSAGVYQFIEEKQKISLSKERRAARTLGIIMGVFVICWLPFFLMYVILPFCSKCCPTIKFKNFITWLGYINSVLNPIIYTIFNLDYRRAFKRLLGLN